MRLLSFVLAIPALLPVHADTAEAERLLRAARPAEALAALDAGDASPAAAFWRGRALVDLGRYVEASYALESVPAGHELAPYAARALIYCAWQSPQLDFPSLVAPLTESPHAEVSRLATAALAEYELRKQRDAAPSAWSDMEKLAAEDTRWELARRLLEVESLRLAGRFDAAIELCRRLEADESLPAIAHHRARLALAEVYYAMEEEERGREPEEPGESFGFSGSAEEVPDLAEGKGEETLLQFIASHPDSPLLEEAFRRLAARGAFERSEYALTQLAEWGSATERPRRAALALRVLQYQRHLSGQGWQEAASRANTALSLLPHEPMTAQMLREEVRVALARGRAEDVALYLRLLPEPGARSHFYEASLAAAQQGESLLSFLRSAELADDELRGVALANALLAALRAGDREEEARIMDSAQPPAVRRALLAVHSAFYMPSDGLRARRDLEEWLQLSPADDPPVDAVMDLAILDMATEPALSLERLRQLFSRPKEQRSPEQELRLCSLMIEAARRAAPQGEGSHAALDMVRLLSGKAGYPSVRSMLTLKHAAMHSGLGNHNEALAALLAFVEAHPRSPEAPRALLMAGHEARSIGSLDSLRHAIALYERCAATPSPCARRARLHQASLLARINRRPEARALLVAELNNPNPLSAEERALATSYLADAWALEGNDAGLDEAIAQVGALLESGEAPEAWIFRLRMLHAVLCSRRGLHEEALADYLLELERMPSLSAVPSEADWFSLYFAGSGAIYQYLRLERYEEAAAMAEHVAKWQSGDAGRAGMPSPGPLSNKFMEWAASIRQVHPMR